MHLTENIRLGSLVELDRNTKLSFTKIHGRHEKHARLGKRTLKVDKIGTYAAKTKDNIPFGQTPMEVVFTVGQHGVGFYRLCSVSFRIFLLAK